MSLTKSDLQEIQVVLTDALAPFIESVEVRFDDMGQRLDKLDAGQVRLEARMDSLEQHVDVLDARLGSVETRLSSVETRLGSLEEQLLLLQGKITALEADIKEIYGMIIPKKTKGETLEEQILHSYETILLIAQKAHVTLPHQT